MERDTLHGGSATHPHNTTRMDTQKFTIHRTKYDPRQSFKKWSQKRVKADDWKLVNQITIDETRCADQTTYEAAYERSADTTGQITIHST